jgi:hypothetical protein
VLAAPPIATTPILGPPSSADNSAQFSADKLLGGNKLGAALGMQLAVTDEQILPIPSAETD